MVQAIQTGITYIIKAKGLRLLSFILLLTISLSSCIKNDLKEVEEITKDRTPAEVSTTIEAVYSDSAKVKAKLNAPEMIRTITKAPTIEMRKGLAVIFYENELAEKSRLRANYGIRYLTTGITKVSGDVQVTNIKGDTMNTEELFWNEPKQKIYSNKFVKVKTKDEIILSEGFESDVGFNDYTFFKVRGRVPVPH